jgi:hypothetical protein
MNTAILEKKFGEMGARVKVRSPQRIFGERRHPNTRSVILNVLRDIRGEFFDVHLDAGKNTEVQILDVQPKDRHLLLLVKEPDRVSSTGHILSYDKQKFLCGHDERHWFVAAIPESAPVGTVEQAKEALKPKEVQAALNQAGVGKKKRNRRKNEVFLRQGEWFFVPVDLKIEEDDILDAHLLRNEPITRGNGGKPHIAEYAYRRGGTTVYVNFNHPNGISVEAYKQLIENDPQQRTKNWQIMQRDAEVFVKGTIRHSDHKTIILNGWHRVIMNTENQSKAMRNVAFLD